MSTLLNFLSCQIYCGWYLNGMVLSLFLEEPRFSLYGYFLFIRFRSESVMLDALAFCFWHACIPVSSGYHPYCHFSFLPVAPPYAWHSAFMVCSLPSLHNNTTRLSVKGWYRRCSSLKPCQACSCATSSLWLNVVKKRAPEGALESSFSRDSR